MSPPVLGGRVTVRRAVAGLVVVALVARLAALGARVAHWDEARVAWWTLRYAETGSYRYYPILHGPLLALVTAPLLEALGRSDAVLRLPTAVVGGLLPAAALLYRDAGLPGPDASGLAGWRGLDDRETVALAGLLAVSPLFVFYSRFFRNDLLVAAFALAALGCVLRAAAVRATRRRWSVALAAAAGGLVGLAFGAKENALLYVLCWLGAGGLLWALGRATTGDDRPTPAGAVYDLGHRTAVAAARWWRHGLAGTTAFLLVVVAVFAPRTGGGRPGIGDLAADPGVAPAVVEAATVGTARRLLALWVLGDVGGGASSPFFLALLVGVVVGTAAALLALAAVGLVAEHRRGRRSLVAFAALWAGLSVFGYPLAVDLVAGWTAVHVAAPLAPVAAVGLVALVRRARPALAAAVGDTPPSCTREGVSRGARRALAGLLLVGMYVGAAGGVAVYGAPAAEYNPYPQPAQPSGDLRPAMDAVRAAVDDDPAPDAVYVGAHYEGGLPSKLPVPWYVRAGGGRSVVRPSAGDLSADPPPVVVTLAPNRPVVAARLDGYACWRGDASAWVGREPDDAETVVFVDRSAVPEGVLRGENCGG